MTGCPSAVLSWESLFLNKILHWKCVVGDLKWKMFLLGKNIASPAFPTCFWFWILFSCSLLHLALVIRAGNFLIPVLHGSLPPPLSFLPVALSLWCLCSHTKQSLQALIKVLWIHTDSLATLRSSSLHSFFLKFSGGLFFLYLTMNHNIQREHDSTWGIKINHIIENLFEKDFTMPPAQRKASLWTFLCLHSYRWLQRNKNRHIQKRTQEQL